MAINKATSTLIKITFATLISKPFAKWKAFELGLIDKMGKKIKDPKTKEEKEALGYITELVRKVKYVIAKFTGDNQAINFILATYLLKEDTILDDSQCKFILEIENELSPLEKDFFDNYIENLR